MSASHRLCASPKAQIHLVPMSKKQTRRLETCPSCAAFLILGKAYHHKTCKLPRAISQLSKILAEVNAVFAAELAAAASALPGAPPLDVATIELQYLDSTS
eukprot:1004428-Prymnesium_polylepis.1